MIQKIFNPFVKIAGLKSAIWGVLIILVSSILAGFFNTRFDGVLDAHYTLKQSFLVTFSDNLINIVSLVTVFFLLGYFLTKGRTRFIDILGTIIFSRYPFILIPLFNIQNESAIIGVKILEMATKGKNIQLTQFEWIYILFMSIFLVLTMIWYVVLLFNAYKVSTNLKQGKLIVSFIIGILLSEILSKIIIFSL